MGIRVLLADDSATIKKVMQLSLHDFGVELKAVSSGEDVLEVARKFNPDIAFVDVLLPQKSGYEIASQFKKDASLSKTPVIVLWSAFMDFDEGKYKTSGADAKLEKPFEAQSLRQLIQKYIPKTVDSPVAKHLEFPVYEFDTTTGSVAKPKQPTESATPSKGWNMDQFEDISNFTQTQTQTAAPHEEGTRTSIVNAINASQEPAGQVPPAATGDSEWVRKDLSKFTVPVPQDQGTEEGTVSFDYADTEVGDTSFLLRTTPGRPHAAPEAPQATAAPAQAATRTSAEAPLLPNAQPPSLSAENIQTVVTGEIEKLVKEQARQIVEKIVWKIVPDMASNLIKEELNRLLKDESL